MTLAALAAIPIFAATGLSGVKVDEIGTSESPFETLAPSLRCFARSISGIELSFSWNFVRVRGTKAEFHLMSPREGSSYPPDELSHLYIHREKRDRDTVYTNDDFYLSIANGNENVSDDKREVAIWTVEDNEQYLPVAFGFCTELALSSQFPPAKATQSLVDPNYAPTCFLTTMERQPQVASYEVERFEDDLMRGRFVGPPFDSAIHNDGYVDFKTTESGNGMHPEVTTVNMKFGNSDGGQYPTGTLIELAAPTEEGTLRVQLVRFASIFSDGPKAVGICNYSSKGDER